MVSVSSGGAPLDVSQTGLATVAATLTSAAGTLAALAATPPVHAPLAADEVSTSAAARLTEHGTVLSSRAFDGAAVLAAAANAVMAAGTHMAEVDQANAATLTLAGHAAPPVGGPASPAAVKTNAVAADTPITPMAPRPGELTAGLIEAGTTSTGTTYTAACRAYQGAFESCAVAARTAETAVTSAITGQTGPRLSAALTKFATWADSMASHSSTLAQGAQDHGSRFEQTQYDTPRTQQFSDTRQSLARAQMLNMQTGGMASGLVAQYASNLQKLDSTATAAGVSYHLTELPQAPPPPPPVTDIVDDGSATSPDGSGQSTDRKPDQTDDDAQGAATDPAAAADGGVDDATTSPGTGQGDQVTDPLADPAADPLLAGDPAAAAMGSDPIQQIAPMAAMLPTALAGALGGALGAVTSVPQQVGQQVMGAAQQIMQGAASSLSAPEDLGLDTDPLDDTGLSGLGGSGLGGSGGGGGGGTEPAGLDTSLPPSGGALAAASGPPGGPALPSSTGVVQPAAQSAHTSAGMGGMMMPPPMMGGMGAGGGGASRTTSPPDKTVVIPSIPNGEPVKGEVERRQTVSVDDQATSKPDNNNPQAGRPRRRVVLPTTQPEGDPKP